MNPRPHAPTLSSRLDVVLQTALNYWRVSLRYRGALMMDVLFSCLVAFLPILFGRAAGGLGAASQFSAHVGTTNYVAFMLIGANVFTLLMRALWEVGYWLRNEQNSGTLESWFLAPTSPLWVLAGVSLFSALRSLVVFALSFGLGCLLWRVNLFSGDLLLAAAFVGVGMLPTYGLSLLFGALILRLKEADSLIEIAQWVAVVLIGIYFPITVLPRWLQLVAWALPPTWVNNGARAALLGLGYFLGRWYLDLALLAALGLVFPLLGHRAVAWVSHRLQRHAGVGGF